MITLLNLLKGGYSVPHMLVDGMIVDAQENRVPVGLQRVISPDVDSTVSQSINSIPITHRHINENDTSRFRQVNKYFEFLSNLWEKYYKMSGLFLWG